MLKLPEISSQIGEKNYIYIYIYIGNKKKIQWNTSHLYLISLNGNRVLETRFLFMEIEYKILEFYWELFFFWAGTPAAWDQN